MEFWNDAKKKIIEQVLWAESELLGKTGAEKKKAVIKKLDDLIKLPACLEWADDMAISYLVDQACTKLNEFSAHNFAGLQISNDTKEKFAEEMKVKK